MGFFELVDNLIKNLAGILTAFGVVATAIFGFYNAYLNNKNRQSIKSGNEITEAVGVKVDEVNVDLTKQVKDLQFNNDVLTRTIKEKDLELTRRMAESSNARKIIDELKKQLDEVKTSLKELRDNTSVLTDQRITKLEIHTGSQSGDLENERPTE